MSPPTPLTVARLGEPRLRRELGRRDALFSYGKLFIPSLLIDQTELLLRQHGVAGDEGFGIWAGTLRGEDAFASTLIAPRIEGSGLHGEISAATAAALFVELDYLDLVPVAQIHSHPNQAFLSSVDAERPIMAAHGFLSIIIPSFGFVDIADVATWSVHEFRRRNSWHELDEAERRRRLIIDPSLIRIG